MLRGLSKRNRRGVWALIVLIAIIIVTPRALKSLTAGEPTELISEKIVRAENEIQKKVESTSQRTKYQKKKKSKRQAYVRPSQKFDPNKYTIEDWTKLGVSNKQAEVIVKFCSRGVSSDEDLKRIYVLPNEVFELIKDSTVYPELSVKPIQHVNSYKREVIDINVADEETLVKLYGIGPFFAQKIVEHREALGGYHSKTQLLEIWKFDQEKLDKIQPQITLGNHALRKLNVNTQTAEELKAHPYISWNVANSIVKMRAKFTKYSNFDQLLESALIDEALLAKMQPYLSL